MACMILPSNARVYDAAAIRERLAGLGIALQEWPVPQQAPLTVLLDQQSLDIEEREAVLAAVAHRLEELRRAHGYSTCDMIVMHEHIPALAEMLARFEKIHYHTDDEVRYILAGRGYFGFVDAAGEQFMLEVTAGDYINVPAGTEHWFTLGDSARIKAVRYFIDASGWTPVYTDRPLAFGLPAAVRSGTASGPGIDTVAPTRGP